MELIQKNEQEFLNNYVLKEYDKYYRCQCPNCGGKEAFMYKDNMSFVNCSRKNACGEVTTIKYEEQLNDFKYQKKNENIESDNKQQYTEQKILSDYINYISQNGDYDFNNYYRGVSPRALKSIGLIKTPPIDSFLQHKKVALHDNLHGILKYNYYDILIPVYNEKNRIDRLIFRTTKDGNYAKVIQKGIIENATKFMHYNVDEAKRIYLVEAPLDSASIIEVDSKAGFISSLQATAPEDMIKFIEKNAMFMLNKEIVLAYDNDIAGYKAQNKLKEIFKVYNITPKYLFLEEFKDPNEALQKDRNRFEKMIANPLEEKEFLKMVNNPIEHDITSGNEEKNTYEITYRNIELSNNRLVLKVDEKIIPIDSSMKVNEIILDYLGKENINEKDLIVLKNKLKNEEAITRMNTSLEQVNDKGLKEFLDFSKNFPQYSAKNTLLLYSQNAVLVKSFNEWKKDNIYLQKGAEAIFIYAPTETKMFQNQEGVMKYIKYATDKEKELIDKGELNVATKTGFKLVPVYDISQTKIPREEYPKHLKPNLPLASDQQKELVADLAKYLKVDIREENTQAAGGYIAIDKELNTKYIAVNTMNSENEQMYTVLHELGHYVAYNQYQKDGFVPGAEIKEVHAEGIAYLVAYHIGLDISERSTHYIQSWSTEDMETFNKEINVIKKGAYFLNSSLNKLIEQKQEINKKIIQDKQIDEIAKEQSKEQAKEVNKKGSKEEVFEVIKEEKVVDIAPR